MRAVWVKSLVYTRRVSTSTKVRTVCGKYDVNIEEMIDVNDASVTMLLETAAEARKILGVPAEQQCASCFFLLSYP